MRRYLRWIIFIVIILIIAIWIDIPNNPGIHQFGIEKDFKTQLGLDLVGGVQALLEADLPEGTDIDPESMQTARVIVENRVNGLGVSEAVVQLAGDRRIVVELPGETDPDAAIETIKQTGLLEFVDMSHLAPELAYTYLGENIITDIQKSEQTDLSTPSNEIFHSIMTGADLKNVQVTQDPLTGEPQVSFELSPDGTRIFREYTSANVGNILAIVLDNQVISAPLINEPITDGQGAISGNFTIDTANALAIQLRYGSLPIPLKVVASQTVGPTLGQDSLQKSMLAGIIGFTVVGIFMMLYYRLPGIIADIAIFIYALLALALFRFIPVTMTLAGIAGFLLSTGSALDANILFFERIKEELRSGRALVHAVDTGWRRAWPSIRDSNIAILITCTILYWLGSTFGTTIVKGFSVTLFLGVIVSLFTAIVITRTLLSLVVEFLKPTNLMRWFGI